MPRGGECPRMPVKAFEFRSIDGKRFSKASEKVRNVRIDNNSSVTQISEINDREANVEFRFTANFAGVGVISIEGTLVFEGEASALAKKWAAEGNMTDQAATEIHSTIMSNCLPEAVLLARDLHLPPPIPLPPINIQSKAKAAARSGPEVA